MKRSELKKLLYSTFGHLDDVHLMALTMFAEARDQGALGIIAVGSVILERVEHRDWDGKTIKEVCLAPFQFSCFLPDDPQFEKLKKLARNWDDRNSILGVCLYFAEGLINGTVPRTSEIAEHHVTQYKRCDCPASWEKDMTKITTIGDHDFYSEKV